LFRGCTVINRNTPHCLDGLPANECLFEDECVGGLRIVDEASGGRMRGGFKRFKLKASQNEVQQQG
jgi:hypothetical protein